MGIIQGTFWWAHLGGIWVLPKRWRTILTTFGDLLEVMFHLIMPHLISTRRKHKPNLHMNWACIEVRSRARVIRWRLIQLSQQNCPLPNWKWLPILHAFLAQGFGPIQDLAFVGFNVPYGDMTVLPFFYTRVKDDSKVLVVVTNTNVRDSTLIQLETTATLTSIVPSASTTL
jgi:hypothetical protein